jgi:hypothetical protein
VWWDTDTGGAHPLCCMASGVDKTPLTPQRMHEEHTTIFTLVQDARGVLA